MTFLHFIKESVSLNVEVFVDLRYQDNDVESHDGVCDELWCQINEIFVDIADRVFSFFQFLSIFVDNFAKEGVEN